jgi:hypothetical protein
MTDVRIGPGKHRKLPRKYSENFLATIDARTGLWGRLMATYEEVIVDMGDVSRLTRGRKALAERFCFVLFFLQSLEKQIAELAEKDRKQALKLFGRYIHWTNNLMGLARSAGMLTKNGKPIMDLRSWAASEKLKEHKGQLRDKGDD